MDEILKFSIEESELLEEDESQFATLVMDVCTIGENSHKLSIDQGALERAKDSLVGKPILAKYNRFTNDATTHTPNPSDQSILGYVANKEDVSIEDRNGKPWIVARGRIWKIYAREMMNVLRNRKEVGISMECLAHVEEDMFGKKRIVDFAFTGVTILGRNVTPAIAGANLKMLTFAQMKKELQTETFAHRYNQIDFIIPEGVKKEAQLGLDWCDEYQRGGTSNNMAMAKYLVRENEISYDRARKMNDTVVRRYSDMAKETPPSDKEIAFCMWGGDIGKKWIGGLVNKMDELDKGSSLSFAEEEAIAIEKEKALALENKEEETPEEEAKESIAEEKEEEVKEEIKEEETEEKVEEVEFSSDAYIDPVATAYFLDKEAELYKKLVEGAKGLKAVAKKEDFAQLNWADPKEESLEKFEALYSEMSEIAKPFFADIAAEEDESEEDLGTIVVGLCNYAKMLQACYFAEKSRADGLNQFKEERLQNEKFARVEALLGSVHDDLEEKDETDFREFAKSMNINEFDSFANTVRAKAYEKAKTRVNKAKPTVQRFANVWSKEEVEVGKTELWAELKKDKKSLNK